MGISFLSLCKTLLGIIIIVSLVMGLVYLVIGIWKQKKQDWKKFRLYALIYFCSNALRLMLEYFKIF